MPGLIPQSFIDDLLNRVDIVEIVDKRVALKKSGKNYTACCPFHNEKTPSFSVQPERQFYYCFGCGAGGNAIGFVMNFDGVEFPEAVERLAQDSGMEVPREESKAASRKQSENAKLLDVLERAARFYQYQLRKHDNKQEAVDYLRNRGVSGEVARDFGLGYAPPGWDNLLNALGNDAAAAQQLEKAGLIVRNDKKQDEEARQHYDRFRHRIMFPIRDSRGRTIAFGGRVLGDDKPKYLNSPETAVFHKGSELYGLFEAKRSNKKLTRILIVEGYMDVIALAQMGIHNAVATLGTATSERHLVRLFRLVPEVVFCFDGDAAGRSAAWRALETTLPLLEDGRQVKFLFPPEGSDPDSFVREQGREAFDNAVNKAVALEDFFFDKLATDIDLGSIEGRARLSNLAKPLIRKMPKGIYAQLMLNRLSTTLDVKPETLSELMADSPQPPAPDIPPPPPTPWSDGRQRDSRRAAKSSGGYRKPAALKAIELLLSNPELATTISQDLSPLRNAEDESRKLLIALIDMVRNDPKTETYTLLGYCYGSSLGSQLTQLLNSERITPIEGSEQEFNQIIDNILSDISKKLNLLQLKASLKSRIGATTAAKDKN